MAKTVARRELRIAGDGHVDLTVTLDYSDSFFRTELALRAGSGDSASPTGANSESDAAAAVDLMQEVAPGTVDFSRKHATTYHFTDLAPGAY